MPTTAELRARALHYTSPEVAASSGMTFEQLRSFISGRYALTAQQETCLTWRVFPELLK